MHPNADVRMIVETLVDELVKTLPHNLEGLYLKGSLALGDFNPETSDIDLLVVPKSPLGQGDFERLDKMHRAIQTLPALARNRYAHEIELIYIPLEAINHFQAGSAYPSLERGEQLKWKRLGSNWILEFWTVREHGIVLFGPDPKTLIDPISSEQIVAAVRGVRPAWLAWVDTWDDPDGRPHLGAMRFALETMCRALYTLAFSKMCSKPVAVRWALETLPEPWRSLVEQSQTWPAAKADSKTVSGVRDFVRWTFSQA